LQALDTWRRVAPVLGAVEFAEHGPLLVGSTPEAVEQIALRAWALREAGATVHELDGDGCRTIEPALSPRVMAGLVVEEDASVQPMLATAALLRAAVARGAELWPSTRAISVAPHAVETREGVLHADQIVLAAGAWSPGLYAEAPLPIEPRRGHLLVAERRASTIVRRGAIALDDLTTIEDPDPDLRVAAVVEPTASGTVLLGSSRERVGFDLVPDRRVLREICAAVSDLYPALADCRILRSWIGFRPWTPDGLPLVGRLAAGLIIAAGHEGAGICFGPLTGMLVRRLIVDDEPPPLCFAPDRFRHVSV